MQSQGKYQWKMVGVLAVGIVLILIMFSIYWIKDKQGPLLEGQVGNFNFARAGKVPPLEPWYDNDGEATNLSNFKNRVVMVNFWATWCTPCVQELPSINRLQTLLSSEKFEVVAINVDREGVAKAQILLDRLKISKLDLYVDPQGKVSRSMGVKAMPTTIIYGPDGREHGRLIGAAEWDSEEAIALLSHYINLY